MKTLFSSKTIIALAVAVVAATANQSQANEQPIPPPANDSALPANIPLGSPVGQVCKLVQAGVDIGVIENYISNCPTAFNLDADKIIALTDAGLPNDIVNAMFAHDKALPPAAVAPVAPVAATPPPAPSVVSAETSPPPPAPTDPTVDLNLNEVSQTLTPYGAWVNVDGYGRCWRPNVVVYDSTWRPYCDRGQWVYTDCGWYWNSDYAWGVTFHYGRWFNSSQYGWCWWPDTAWAPSWVTWRSANDSCGWAPLPPYTVYTPGVGFTYRGGNVSLSFGFGLTSSCYTFVSVGNFCQPHPRYYCYPQTQVAQIYNQTTIINNYNCRNKTIINNGVSVTYIGDAARRPIQPVPVGSVSNGGRRNWHGQSVNSPGRHFGSDASDNTANREFTANGSRGDRSSTTATSSGAANNRHDQRESASTARDANNSSARPAQTETATAPVNRRDSRDQRGSNFATRNPNPAQPTAPLTAAPIRPAAPVATAPTQSQPPQNQRGNAGNETRQIIRQYTASPAPVAAPGRTTPPNNWATANTSRPATRPDVREQPRQVVTQPRYTPPVAVATPPVVSQRPQQQRSEPRQNDSRQSVVQSTPRPTAPAMQSRPTPAPSQPQNGNGNANGRSPNWMAQNR